MWQCCHTSVLDVFPPSKVISRSDRAASTSSTSFSLLFMWLSEDMIDSLLMWYWGKERQFQFGLWYFQTFNICIIRLRNTTSVVGDNRYNYMESVGHMTVLYVQYALQRVRRTEASLSKICGTVDKVSKAYAHSTVKACYLPVTVHFCPPGSLKPSWWKTRAWLNIKRKRGDCDRLC